MPIAPGSPREFHDFLEMLTACSSLCAPRPGRLGVQVWNTRSRACPYPPRCGLSCNVAHFADDVQPLAFWALWQPAVESSLWCANCASSTGAVAVVTASNCVLAAFAITATARPAAPSWQPIAPWRARSDTKRRRTPSAKVLPVPKAIVTGARPSACKSSRTVLW